jgi:isocitrate/isopropylmalate dehydrogenase
MMEESFNSLDLGNEIDKAVEAALHEGRTVDIKSENLKTLSTIEMGDLIATKLKSSLKD